MKKRLEKVKEKLREENLSALLITNKANKFYLSGFGGTDVALIITKEAEYIIADGRYIEQIKEEVQGFIIIDNGGEMVNSLVKLIRKLGSSTLGIESQELNVNIYLSLISALPQVQLIPTNNVVEKVRMIKDDKELSLLRKASEITDTTFSHCLDIVKPGMTEKELAFELERFIKVNGGEGCSFETIVASGKRSAQPHGHASNKKILAGELVTVDFGVVYQKYYSDMTRTFAIGEVAPELKTIYQLVNESGLKALRELRVGMTTGEVDNICRDYISQAGYGKYFNHGTGHGIGLSCHEYPYLKPKKTEKLLSGMTFTIEPGIYLPGLGGVRIEDDIYLRSDGVGESLTKSQRDWTELSC
ncbi:M24 family metallopeptidase [Vagococcus salmoninarum]|uniref:M24 family metallopeptidase n=1 Tax=Vagococcus salmoninarum TaxID=2739 RepID=UPI003F9E95DD